MRKDEAYSLNAGAASPNLDGYREDAVESPIVTKFYGFR
jgi:hypothetical protein